MRDRKTHNDDFNKVIRPTMRGEMAMVCDDLRVLNWCGQYEAALTEAEEEITKLRADREHSDAVERDLATALGRANDTIAALRRERDEALAELDDANSLIEWLRKAEHCPAHGFGLSGGGRGCHCADRRTPSQLRDELRELRDKR